MKWDVQESLLMQYAWRTGIKLVLGFEEILFFLSFFFLWWEVQGNSYYVIIYLIFRLLWSWWSHVKVGISLLDKIISLQYLRFKLNPLYCTISYMIEKVWEEKPEKIESCCNYKCLFVLEWVPKSEIRAKEINFFFFYVQMVNL